MSPKITASNRKPDRRVRRTHKQLHEALIVLIMEKGYDSVTVQDITDRADLSRATFYIYYNDKEDLLVSTLEDMFDTLVQTRGKLTPAMLLENGSPPSLLAFQHAQEYSTLYRAMLSERGVALVMHRILKYLAVLAQQQIEALLPPDFTPHIPLPVIAHYLAGSLFSLIVWWLEHDMPHPPEEMARIFQTLVMPAILTGIGKVTE